MLKLLALLALIPPVFAAAPNTTLSAMEVVWYMIALCVFAVLFILHHLMLEQKGGKKWPGKRATSTQ